METKDIPGWILSLEKEDVEFIKNFVMNSGSLKEMAKYYGVSYPTVRIRLDKLIQKIMLHEQTETSGFIHFIKQLSIDDRVSLEDAKLIIDQYKKEKDAE